MINPMKFRHGDKQRDIKNLFQENEEYYKLFGQDMLRGSVLFKFHPDNCRATQDNDDRRFIGIAPSKSKIAKAVATDIELLCKVMFINHFNVYSVCTKSFE